MGFFERTREAYRFVHSEKAFYKQLFLGLGVFLIGMAANIGANVYASKKEVLVVNDLILDFLPVFNINYLYVEGAFILILFAVLLAFYRPQRLPFMLKSVGLFIFVRSFFIILTHLSVPLPEGPSGYTQSFGTISQLFSSGNDLFFSGHTGFPFLLSLIFWKDKLLRYLFLATSCFFGVVVLLGHLHYSIDVFAAFFITYAIHDLSVWLFTKDHNLFHFIKQKIEGAKTPVQPRG